MCRNEGELPPRPRQILLSVGAAPPALDLLPLNQPTWPDSGPVSHNGREHSPFSPSPAWGRWCDRWVIPLVADRVPHCPVGSLFLGARRRGAVVLSSSAGRFGRPAGLA